LSDADDLSLNDATSKNRRRILLETQIYVLATVDVAKSIWEEWNTFQPSTFWKSWSLIMGVELADSDDLSFDSLIAFTDSNSGNGDSGLSFLLTNRLASAITALVIIGGILLVLGLISAKYTGADNFQKIAVIV